MILPIYKPAGLTSHDVVNCVRRHYGIRKVGHAGTLDPFATGVLIVLIGRESTKRSQEFMKQDKIYRATLCLGSTSDTHDRDGQIQESDVEIKPSLVEIKKVVMRYHGVIDQIPPMHSAIKVQGKKLYQLARRGIALDLPPRQVMINQIKILGYRYPHLELEISCGSGTYIRSLARDIGEDLGTGAYLEELERRVSGEFRLENCYTLSNLPPLEDSKLVG